MDREQTIATRILSLAGLGITALALGGSPKRAERFNRDAECLISPQTKLPSPLLSFVAVGDVGTGRRGQYDVARSMTQLHDINPFSLVLLLGDNIYENGEIEKSRRCSNDLTNHYSMPS